MVLSKKKQPSYGSAEGRTMKKILLLSIMMICVVLSGCTFQHGTTRDIVQGWDKGILWHHMYLKNDHTTAYCFDNLDFTRIFDEAQKTQKEVIITYETYLIRGSLCSTSDKFENVIITNVQFID